MRKKCIYIFIVDVYISLMTSASDVSVRDYNATIHTSVKRDNKTYYADFYEQGVEWDEADATCKVNYGFLLSTLPTGSELYSKLNIPGLECLWVGIRRKANYYIKDSPKYPELFKEKKEKSAASIGELWRDGEDFRFDCVVLVLNSGELMTQNCSSRHPFVCERKRDGRRYPDPCPESWYLSPPLSITGRKCISEPKEDVPYTEAVNSCARHNKSRLASKHEYEILRLRNQLYFKRNDQEFWALKEDDNITCSYHTFETVYGTLRHPSCSKLLPFICVQSVEAEDVNVTIEVGLSKNSVDPLQIFPWNYACPIKDMIICGQSNHGTDELQFVLLRDNIPVKSLYSSSYRFNFLIDDFKWSENSYNNLTLQGSYQCEGRFRGSVRTYRSKKIDFFFQDIATYIIDIHGIGLEKYTDYSSSTFSKEFIKTNKAINKILEQKKAKWDFKSAERTDESYSMKLVVFEKRTSSYDNDEAYKTIKLVFEGKAHLLNLGQNVSVQVHSADVCFHSDLKQNDTCNDIKWPTTIQAKNVPSETACLNEHKKFVHRECKGSTISKAEWSSFDCSKCKHFKKRFQEEKIQCPRGYKKFENQDLCFKIYPERKNWSDAYKTCAEYSSYLLDVPHEIDIGNGNSLWLAFKYSYGKIQGFGQKPINIKALYEKEQMLLKNADEKSYELHCISAIQEESGFKFKLENCSLEMSFVCVQRLYEIVGNSKFASTSFKLYKHNNVDSCYYLEKLPHSWEEAIDFCTQKFNGAKLVSGVQDSVTYSSLKTYIRNQYSNATECDTRTWWMDFEDAIKNGMPLNLSYVDWGPSADFKTSEPHGVITLLPDKEVYWSLEKAYKKLGVICKIEDCYDDRPSPPNIEKRPFLKTDGSKDTLDWLKTFYLECVPSCWYVADSISWYKDDIFLGITSHALFLHNISNMSEQKALNFQGFYSCSVDSVKMKETVNSPKHLIKIPEFYTFPISMTSEKEQYLADCPKYVLSPELYENTALYQCFNENWKKNLNLDEFHFLLKDLKCHSSFIDIQVHVFFKESNLTEREIFEKVKNADFSNFCKACDIDPISITTQSTTFCNSDEVSLKTHDLKWPITEVGKSSFPDEICLTNEVKLLQRRCLGDFNSAAFWSDAPNTECIEDIAPVSENLTTVLISVIEGSIRESLPHLPDLLSRPELLNPSDIEITAEIFETLAEREEPLPPDKLRYVVEAVNHTIEVNKGVLSEVANSTNRVFGYLERIASNIDEETYERNISTKNAVVNVYPLNSEKLVVPNGIYILNSSSSPICNASVKDLENGFEERQNFEAGVVIPESLLYNVSKSSKRLVYSFLRNIYHQENVSVLSVVTIVGFHNVSVYNLGRENIKLFFKLNSAIDKNSQKYVECVSWNESLQEWSDEGCLLRNISQNSALCACNHLTSFTVIMRKSPPPGHKDPLKYITIIGCSLSCIGLGIIILTFICFREWRKSLKNKCLLNYSLSHVLFLAIFLAGVDKTGSVWCKVTAIFLHYFLLSSFTWMVVLAYTVYLSLVKVFATYIPRLIQKAVAFAWGVPAVFIIVTLSLSRKHYGGEELCWLSQDAFTYGVIIPLILILIINYIVFGSILYLNTCGAHYIACNQTRKKLLVTRAKALLCTSILLGLSWVFGCFTVISRDDYQIYFMYLFAITTTLQGFLLAVFFIFLPNASRELWINLLASPAYAFKSHSSHLNSSYVTFQGAKNA